MIITGYLGRIYRLLRDYLLSSDWLKIEIPKRNARKNNKKAPPKEMLFM